MCEEDWDVDFQQLLLAMDSVLAGDCELDKAGAKWLLPAWPKAAQRVGLRLAITQLDGFPACDQFDMDAKSGGPVGRGLRYWHHFARLITIQEIFPGLPFGREFSVMGKLLM